jgi:hypothetical protein
VRRPAWLAGLVRATVSVGAPRCTYGTRIAVPDRVTGIDTFNYGGTP